MATYCGDYKAETAEIEGSDKVNAFVCDFFLNILQ